MIDVHLESRGVFPWETTGWVRTRGRPVFDGGEPPAEPTLAFDPPDWARSLSNVPGSIALVAERGGSVIAAVDRCRSFPLFYAVRGPDFYLSDDARWIRDRLGESLIDPVALAEAFVCGFVSGKDTLCPSVKQIPVGEMMRARVSDREVSVESWRWDRPSLAKGEESESRDLQLRDRFDELDAVLRKVAHRLFESLDGRCLVIPLSGGHDSRLVALLAKASGYDRVVCLGAHRPDHWEARVAREVAERLGFDWAHFAWSRREWREKFGPSVRASTYRQADGLSALPALVEWPALVELRRSGRVPEDAIVVPGHFGNSVTGACAPARVGEGARGLDAAERAIIRGRYVLNRWPEDHEMRKALLARVTNAVHAAACDSAGANDIVDRWEWREYRAKQVGISARAYEILGYEWRFPYMDQELVRFWRRASRSERAGSLLHHAYVTERGRPWSLPPANPGVVAPEMSTSRRLARRLNLLDQVRRLRLLARRLDGRGIARGDSLGWSGLFNPEDVAKTYTGMEGVQSFLARDWLECVCAEKTDTMGGEGAGAFNRRPFA